MGTSVEEDKHLDKGVQLGSMDIWAHEAIAVAHYACIIIKSSPCFLSAYDYRLQDQFCIAPS